MPKEITHWLISTRTAEALRGTRLGDAALAHPNALQLGAIFPDILYYLPDSRKRARSLAIARAFHGAGGEDTYELVRRILAVLRESPCRPQMLALLLGVITHIHADVAFHPLVFYLTGDRQDAPRAARSEATQRHRRFESLIDVFFCGGSARTGEHSLERIWAGLEMDPAELAGLLPLEGRGGSGPSVEEAMGRALGNLRRMNRLYRCRRLAGLLYPFWRLLPGRVREIVALCYAPQLDAMAPRVSGALSYRHPVTGEAGSDSLAGCFEKAVQGSAAFARMLEPAIAAGAVPVLAERGPSLNYGLCGVSARQARYFAVHSSDKGVLPF